MGAPKGTIPPAAGMGRPKGCKNKFTNLKHAFMEAFEGMGGAEGLLEWGRKEKNRGEFYKMLSKLLPKEVQASVRGAIMLAPKDVKKPKDAGR